MLSPFLSTSSANLLTANEIPSNVYHSFRDWVGMNEKEAERAELRLLRRLPCFRLPSEPLPPFPSLTACQYHHPISNSRHLNVIELSSVPPPSVSSDPARLAEYEREMNKDAIVVLHGYGMGSGFYWLNWFEVGKIAAATNRKAYFIDLMGMGRSARPHPKVFDVSKKTSDAERARIAEDFFLEPLEEFRIAKGIETLSIVGHSLGGYLSAVYTLRHPKIVKSLILLSPAGIPSPAPDTEASSSSSFKPRTKSSSSSSQQPPRPSSSARTTPSSPKKSANTELPSSQPASRRSSFIPSFSHHFEFSSKVRRESITTQEGEGSGGGRRGSGQIVPSSTATSGDRSPADTAREGEWRERRKSEGLEGLAERLKKEELSRQSPAPLSSSSSPNAIPPASSSSQTIASSASPHKISFSSSSSSLHHNGNGDHEISSSSPSRTEQASHDPEAAALGAPPGLEVEGEEDEEDSDGGERKIQRFKGPMGKSGPMASKVYSYMWESNLSPLGVIRKVGPLGPLLVGKYAHHRFEKLSASSPSLARDLNSYLTNIIALPGSGEYAVSSLLKPGAFGRLPIAPRMAALGQEDVEVTFAYGEKDWMSTDGGKEALRAMRRKGNDRGEVVVVSDAGHHLYMDNADDTNALLWRKLGPKPNPAPEENSTTIADGSTSPNTLPSSPLPLQQQQQQQHDGSAIITSPSSSASPSDSGSGIATPASTSYFPGADPDGALVVVREKAVSPMDQQQQQQQPSSSSSSGLATPLPTGYTALR